MRDGGGNCLKYLKKGWNSKEGKKHKNFKKGGQAGSSGGCLKMGGGAGTSLRTMNIGLKWIKLSICNNKKLSITLHR